MPRGRAPDGPRRRTLPGGRPPSGPPGRSRRLATDEHAVTPVVGSILVLAITVIGVAAILFWGAPTIADIQDRNAQMGVIGEFEEIRVSSLALSVPDASRTPTVVFQDGSVGLQPGTRFMVTANHDPSHTGCDLHVTGWHEGGDTVSVGASGCRTPVDSCSSLSSSQACFEVHQVAGDNLVRRTPSGGPSSFTVSGAELSTGNWLFRLTDGATSPTVYAQAWLLESDMHVWQHSSARSERAVYHDGSAVFSRTDQTTFLELDPPIQEDAFGSGDYVLWLRTYSSQSQDEVSGRNSVSVYLGLVGTYNRIHTEDAYTLRYDFHGELSEAWCSALEQRTARLSDGSYTADGACSDTVPSVIYQMDDPTDSFPMEFLHAQIRTTLLL